MKILKTFFFFTIAGLISTIIINGVHSAPYDYKKTVVTRNIRNIPQMSYSEYIANHTVLPFEFNFIKRGASIVDDPLPFVIIVESDLYTQIGTSVDTYISDLTDDGFEATLFTSQGGTPENLKEQILIPEWEDSAVGCLLVGDLPIPWFELYEDFDDNGIPDNNWRVDFPCDIFYMDMDGEWVDTAGTTGVYDGHEGDWEPDIWVGQIRANTMSGNEALLVQNYFQKNHDYRTDELYLPDMALAYIDDDWSGGAPEWANALEQAWANTVLVSDINATTADDYQARWDDDYAYVLLAAHSAPSLHTLKQNNGQSWDDVYNWEIIADDPHFLFYNLFCCSNCLYTETDYCGGAYLFNDTYGIDVVGSTKTGSMLFFDDYYQPLGEGETFGEALNQWLTLHANQPGSWMWARSWFYGMTNLGDPTLKKAGGIELQSFAVIDDGSGNTSGDGDGIPDAGETIELRLSLINTGNSIYNNLMVYLTTEDTLLDFQTPITMLNSIPPGEIVEVGGIVLSLSPESPDNHSANIDIEISDYLFYQWYDALDLLIRASKVQLVSYNWREISGNINGVFDVGDVIGITFGMKNLGGQECYRYNPGIVSPYGNLQETAIQGEYYFPLDTEVELDEITTEIISLPQNSTDPLLVCTFNDTLPQQVHDLFYLSDGGVSVFDQFDDELTAVTYPVDPYYGNEWWLTQSWVYSPPSSYRFGEGSTYSPLCDGVLELPLIRMGSDAWLSFQHRYEVEEGYDGGIVEMFYDNEWQLITPEGGYPGSSVSNGSYPGGPCYNGFIYSYQRADFDLSDYSGFVKLRFRFGSDGGAEEEGWYIDDVEINSEELSVLSGNIETPFTFKLEENYPNPFNPATSFKFSIPQEGIVKFTVYNSLGQEVARLADEIMTAGHHQINWDAGDLASGLYLYRLDFDDRSLIGKSVLLK